jgi:hypothetical protein
VWELFEEAREAETRRKMTKMLVKEENPNETRGIETLWSLQEDPYRFSAPLKQFEKTQVTNQKRMNQMEDWGVLKVIEVREEE